MLRYSIDKCFLHCMKLIISTQMMHGLCGMANENSPSIIDDGYPPYRRSNNGFTKGKNIMLLDNRCVIPYNPSLFLKQTSHINVKHCNQSISIKYLFKYVNKGHEKVISTLKDCHPICINNKWLFFQMIYEPNVFLANHNSHSTTMLIAWFNAHKMHEEAKHLSYANFPKRFVYKENFKEWVSRKGSHSIGCHLYILPGKTSPLPTYIIKHR